MRNGVHIKLLHYTLTQGLRLKKKGRENGKHI